VRYVTEKSVTTPFLTVQRKIQPLLIYVCIRVSRHQRDKANVLYVGHVIFGIFDEQYTSILHLPPSLAARRPPYTRTRTTYYIHVCACVRYIDKIIRPMSFERILLYLSRAVEFRMYFYINFHSAILDVDRNSDMTLVFSLLTRTYMYIAYHSSEIEF